LIPLVNLTFNGLQRIQIKKIQMLQTSITRFPFSPDLLAPDHLSKKTIAHTDFRKDNVGSCHVSRYWPSASWSGLSRYLRRQRFKDADLGGLQQSFPGRKVALCRVTNIDAPNQG
jgi:hypothetical protein